MLSLKNWVVGIIFFISPSFAFTQENDVFPEWILQNAPSSYIVKSGDTLWDVACTFLRDPWRWPEVLCFGSDEIDPNLVYPGDKLILGFEKGSPRLKLERGKTFETVDKHTGVVKLRPRARILPPDNPIPTISLSVIGPFLNHSRVVNDNQAYNSPCIVALDEDHIVVGAGDRIYVSGMSSRILDDVFTVFRPGKRYIDPCTKRDLGIEGYVLGTAEREVIGDPSRWILTQSFAEIKVGDRLIATLEEKLEPYFVPRFPQAPSEGQIISVFDGMTQIGQYQVIVITGGQDRCREVGDALAIYQTQKDFPAGFFFRFQSKYEYPPMKVGHCLVFRVFDKVSYALVMDATRTIYLLDYVGPP